jgi:hypothetical protein
VICSPRGTAQPGSAVRGSEGDEVMIRGVGVHAAGGFWGVDNARQDHRSNALWAGCFWRIDAGRVGEEIEPNAFKFRALTGHGTEYRRTLSESKVTSCGHEVPCCCGALRCGVVKGKASLA